jgi:hypothetical protein
MGDDPNMRTKTIYWTMLGSMFLRLFWLTTFEPKGSKLAISNNPDSFIAHTLPYVVYPSIVILIGIILFVFLKKQWAYIAGMVFGIVHLVLILPLVILKLHPGSGPLIVIPVCLVMIVFSYLSYNRSNAIRQLV